MATETFDMNPTIYSDAGRCSIIALFDRVAKILYGVPADRYDCTKIEVGEGIYELIRENYLESGYGSQEFAMAWACYGPNATLKGYQVRVEDGFAVEE